MELRNSTRTVVAAAIAVAVALTASACGGDQGKVKEVQTVRNPKGDGGVARNLIVKKNDGSTVVDGPYLTLKGIGSCRAGSGWPSCLDK